MEEEIIRLPSVDKNIGSCPECGKTIWSSYLIVHSNVYRCIHCKTFVCPEDVIPF